MIRDLTLTLLKACMVVSLGIVADSPQTQTLLLHF